MKDLAGIARDYIFVQSINGKAALINPRLIVGVSIDLISGKWSLRLMDQTEITLDKNEIEALKKQFLHLR